MIVADFSFVGQGSDIAETTIYTPSAEGVFRLSVYFPSRNALGAGTHVAFNLSYPDNTENWVNYPLLSLDMGSKNIQWACLLFFAASGSPISFNCTADGVIGAEGTIASAFSNRWNDPANRVAIIFSAGRKWDTLPRRGGIH
jgi:hypothetical protein